MARAHRPPADSEEWYRVGNALVDLGRDREAVVAFEEALRLKPDHLTAHTNLALLAFGVGEPDLADRHIRALYALDEDRARWLDALLRT